MNLMRIAARVAAANNKCVYVDLDETLIHTVPLNNPANAKIFKAFPGEKIQRGLHGTMLRPGAVEFLASLRALNVGPIYLLTHSVASYAGTMVAAFGLDVDEVFSRESLSGSVGNGETQFVLVDDLDSLDIILQMKARAMGIPAIDDSLGDDEKRAYFAAWHVRPDPFVGDPNDTGLVGIAETVAATLTP